MYNRANERDLRTSRFVAVRHHLEVLDPVRMGTAHLSISLHPQTRNQFDYIRETWMEHGLSSGWMHNESEFHAAIKGLGTLTTDVAAFRYDR